MIGGAGDDLYIVDNTADFVVEGISGGRDLVKTSVNYVLAANVEIEQLETTDLSDTATIDLVGNAFDNVINGNDGQNTLVGGLGFDTLTGHGGGDVFVWRSTAETGPTAATADIVGGDFNPLTGDLLAFNLIDANDTAAGNQAFTFIGAAGFTSAGQIRAFSDGFDTFIQLNTGGDATAEAMVRVQGVHSVDASWFVL